jgi:hypothetical protein
MNNYSCNEQEMQEDPKVVMNLDTMYVNSFKRNRYIGKASGDFNINYE